MNQKNLKTKKINQLTESINLDFEFFRNNVSMYFLQGYCMDAYDSSNDLWKSSVLKLCEQSMCYFTINSLIFKNCTLKCGI